MNVVDVQRVSLIPMHAIGKLKCSVVSLIQLHVEETPIPQSYSAYELATFNTF